MSKAQSENNKIISHYKAELILVFVSFTWGLSFPLIKIGLVYCSPVLFVLIRFGFTLLIFLGLHIKEIKYFKFAEYKFGLILGVLLFFGFITQTAGLKYTTASNSAFITGTNIVLIPFVQIWLLKSKPKIENVLGILIVSVGLYFLTEIDNLKINAGDILTLFCAVSFAFYIVLLDKFSSKVSTIQIIFGQFLITTVLSLFSVIIFEGMIFNELKFEFNTSLLISLLFNIIFNTFLGLYLSTKFQKYTTPVKAGLIYNLEQIFAVISAFIILGEMLTAKQVTGAGIMILGIIVSEFYREILKKMKKN